MKAFVRMTVTEIFVFLSLSSNSLKKLTTLTKTKIQESTLKQSVIKLCPGFTS